MMLPTAVWIERFDGEVQGALETDENQCQETPVQMNTDKLAAWREKTSE